MQRPYMQLIEIRARGSRLPRFRKIVTLFRKIPSPIPRRRKNPYVTWFRKACVTVCYHAIIKNLLTSTFITRNYSTWNRLHGWTNLLNGHDSHSVFFLYSHCPNKEYRRFTLHFSVVKSVMDAVKAPGLVLHTWSLSECLLVIINAK